MNIQNTYNVKIWHISDTHGLTHHIGPQLVHCIKALGCSKNILIHSGDATNNGTEQELYALNKTFGDIRREVPEIAIIFVIGNHDLYSGLAYTYIAKIVSNATVLLNSTAKIHGITIHGIPWLSNHHWDYKFKRGETHANKGTNLDCFAVPRHVDVLVTHGPPYGILDEANGHKHNHKGSKALRRAVERQKPSLHLFGHIHEQNTRGNVGQVDPSGFTHNEGGIRRLGYAYFVNSAMAGRWDRRHALLNDFHLIDVTPGRHGWKFNPYPIWVCAQQ